MTLTPVTFEQFGGLNVAADPFEVAATGAVDLSNVDFDRLGRVRTRDGSTALTAAAASPHTVCMAYSSANGVEQLLTRVGTTVTPYALSSGSIGGATQSASPTSNNAFVNIGVAAEIRTYMAAGTLYQYDATGFTSVGSVPISATLAAVTANDNRLVISDGLRIHWSDPFDPETFGVNDWVDLWPGDGETIKALVRWRDRLFAFKQTKFAVFTNTSIDADGNPVFNYYGVDAGRGVYAVGQAVAGEEGVYFADLTGIYLTTGEPARYISRPLEPWLKAGAYEGLPAFSLATAILAYHDGRLYVTYPDGASSVTLVYDPRLDSWMVWQLGAVSMAGVPASSTYRGLYFGEFTSKKVAELDPTAAADQGTAITWTYTSGKYALADPGTVAIAPESSLVGSGTVSLRLDSETYTNQNGTVALGTAPAVAEGWPANVDQEGRWLQFTLSGTGQASVSELKHYLSSKKPVGVQ